MNQLEEDYRFNPFYSYSLDSKYPFVTLSFGMSLDGKIATYTGDSKYISGPEALEFIHHLRHQHQAILIGINTVLIDHPKLTTRLKNANGNNPIKIILDTSLKIDINEPLFTSSDSLTYIVTHVSSNPTKKQTLREKGIKIIEINEKPMPVDEILIQLKDQGISSVLVEGGGTIHFAFIKARRFNRLYATISPIIIGGDKAKTAVAGEGFDTLKAATKLKFINWTQFGNDYIIEAIPDEKNNAMMEAIK